MRGCQKRERHGPICLNRAREGGKSKSKSKRARARARARAQTNKQTNNNNRFSWFTRVLCPGKAVDFQQTKPNDKAYGQSLQAYNKIALGIPACASEKRVWSIQSAPTRICNAQRKSANKQQTTNNKQQTQTSMRRAVLLLAPAGPSSDDIGHEHSLDLQRHFSFHQVRPQTSLILSDPL